MTAKDITTALFQRYADPNHYIALSEFQPGTCYKNDRRFDFYVIDCWGNCDSTAFEIKVSRSDFLSEIKKPDKKRLALHFSNEFYFVAPKGIIKPEELPCDCGLMEATQEDDTIKLRVTRPAIYREAARPTWRFLAATARVLSKNALDRFQAEREQLSKAATRAVFERNDAQNKYRWLLEDVKRLTESMSDEEIRKNTSHYWHVKQSDQKAS